MFFLKKWKNKISDWKRIDTEILWYTKENLKKSEEIIWSNVFHDSIIGCKWLPEGGMRLYPGRWAIGYNALYILFRILNDVKPNAVLELGMGQSTRLIGEYAKNADCKHIVIEHDKRWIDNFLSEFELSDKTRIIQLELEESSYVIDGQDVSLYKYSRFRESLPHEEFCLISIDGPYGNHELSRIDILDIIPDYLSNSFCIVIDDYNREGEYKMAELLRDLLKKKEINYVENTYTGAKDVLVLSSEDLGFLTTL